MKVLKKHAIVIDVKNLADTASSEKTIRSGKEWEVTKKWAS